MFDPRIADHPRDNEDVLVSQVGSGLVKPEVAQVLRSDEVTNVLTLVGNKGETPRANLIEFTFTDARGEWAVGTRRESWAMATPGIS
ncbi:hypothetical protein A5636_05215 [Mycobacterium asiaticum]|uniref:Uncharacterized protein n=1 Tax=Mycobacterium asiaticum TaxID=1790 RepID=A0A1A3N5U6_MYCAS|nr:hypothetical protein A5636_05215 [Mycobacterium asiaticum]